MFLTEKPSNLFDLGTLGQLETARVEGLRSMSELLPWMMGNGPQEDAVINKDSAFMACFEYTGPDTDSLPAEQLLNVMQQGEKVVKSLSDYPITFWFITHRRRIPSYTTQVMPDKWSQIVDDERARAITASANFENRHFVALSLAAEAGLNRLWGRYKHARTHEQLGTLASLGFAAKGIWSDQFAFAYTSTELGDVAKHFEVLVDSFGANLPALNLRRLAHADLGGFLHACATPASGHYPVELTDFLDDAMSNGEVIPGPDFLWFLSEGRSRIGKVSSLPTTHKVWPEKVSPQQLDDLLKVPAELTISHVFRLQSENANEKMIDGMRSYHESNKLNLRGMLAAAINKGDPNFEPRENRGRSEAADEAEDLKGDVTRGRKAFGQYTFSVTAYSSAVDSADSQGLATALEEASEASSLVHKALGRAKFAPIRETIGVLSAWTASIPGAWRDIARWVPISNKVFARLPPLRTVASGSRENRHLASEMKRPSPALAALPTDYATPYYWTGFYGDIGHTLLSGETGMGKTTLLNLAWTLFRKYNGTEIFAFDRTNSSRIPILMQGGLYFDPSTTNGATINPISLISHDRHLKFVTDWVCLLAGRRGYDATTEDYLTVGNILKATRNLDRKNWRLGAVVVQLPIGPLRTALEEWSGENISARWFDNQQDLFEDLAEPGSAPIAMASWAARPVGIEMARVLDQVDVAVPFLDYCFYRIHDRIETRRSKGQISPTVILLPEVWGYLADARFSRKLAEWIDTLRKLLGCVWMDAQSPERYINSSIYPSIRDNVPNRIILPYPAAASSPSLREAFTELGLNPQQIKAISEGTPKQDYFLSHKDGFLRRVILNVDRRSLAILRSELSAQAVFDKWLNSGREDWREAYFQEMSNA
ncbi:VirB4 family type IV secretion system protein [Achromobacter aloeverae]